MKKEEIMFAFATNHSEVVDYVTSLSEKNWNFKTEGKWSAGQQLKHIYLTLTPFTNALTSKEMILEKFGSIARPTWSFEEVLQNFELTSRQSVDRYLPGEVGYEERHELLTNIQETVSNISSLFLKFEEEELDFYTLPHPLLGIVTLREMFYLMSNHPTRHLNAIKVMLK